MAPIRRYLRITRFSVLEVRIYLDNPALAQSWLLNPRAPVLPKVIEAVRPLVLPKLREERERSRKKSTKKRAIKDVVTEDDFEVAIFLTETDTRHSILYKDKRFRDKTQTRLRSNSKKLTGGDSADAAINVEGDDDAADSNSDVEVIQAADGDEIPMIRREDSDDDAGVPLHNIPAAPGAGATVSEGRGTKRRRQSTVTAINNNDKDQDDDAFEIVDSGDEDDDLESESSHPTRSKRVRQPAAEADEKKKKLAMDITYNSFAIYGRVLCLVVKKRGVGNSSNLSAAAATSGHGKAAAASSRAAGQARMENWIASTQIMPVAEQGEEGA
ncbi:hypothetical protein MCOR27_011708 [Pyricularia oryzae]|uniref:Uncharacterized protein n=1 Tax=Pyricularia grisea TaxID=148305 RepID=A0ABQ8N361_PYRGI|nr:hypothetical protein MCOR01_010687 [Pyricularia oryzae]KAI6290510.1 hypothetical protein MCOR33_011246 [Pyricularia grisea]KAH9438292.1 hypothetical protein MCOR02_001930 [Pyricularia oryzae]KAI6251974.1 hypothetical protein MCOR19_011397 [Pyricularia oryzae]KAI6264477.1 hypothetical protein MCOR27_011708 [Pyricularia oryzae]